MSLRYNADKQERKNRDHDLRNQCLLRCVGGPKLLKQIEDSLNHIDHHVSMNERTPDAWYGTMHLPIITAAKEMFFQNSRIKKGEDQELNNMNGYQTKNQSIDEEHCDQKITKLQGVTNLRTETQESQYQLMM